MPKTLDKEKFSKFYDEIAMVATNAKGAPGSIAELLKKYKITPTVPKHILERIQPILDTPSHKLPGLDKNECAACAVCAVCTLCGELNGMSGVVGVAGVAGI